MSTTLDYKHDIPPIDEKSPPTYVEKDVFFSSDSVYSSDTPSTLVNDGSFHEGTNFHINARGHELVRLPLPSSQLEIEITDSVGNLVYISKREKRCSGNAVLSHIKLGDLVSTSYFFGPNRDPVIQMLRPMDASMNSIKVNTRWRTRAVAFTLADGKTFQWFYLANTKDKDGRKINVIALRQVEAGEERLKKKEKPKIKVIAKLTRSAETRTEGTSRTTAGNGGQLVLDEDVASYLNECVVVATCLMMLKKEIDRRRGLQMAVIAGGASGGN